MAGIIGVNGLLTSDDLNTTLNSGSYMVPSHASNNPTGDWSVLIVAGNGRDALQIISPLQSVSILVRIKKDGGTFTDWKQIPTTSV